MILDYAETFATDPGVGSFALSGGLGGAPSVTYNSSAQAVDLVGGLIQNAWIFNRLTSTATMVFEADLELISDPSGRKHLGIWLASEGVLMSGYRIFHIDSIWGISKWNGWGSETSLSVTSYGNPTFNSGERKILKIERNGSLLSVYVNEVLIMTASDNTYMSVQPGIFLYGCTCRVHSISDKIAGDLKYSQLPTALLWANEESRVKAWPGENRCKQTASQTAKKVYGVTTAAMLNAPPLRKDFGFIEGVITRKTAPAVGQHVICLDDRFNLVAETLSGAGGYYRFDSLPINGLYAIHAYDNNEYKYAPVGADRRTPEAYA